MITISFARHQFPPAIIRHTAWLYIRFTLSYRDVEEFLAERGLDVSYEDGQTLGAEVWPAVCPRKSSTSRKLRVK
jgi:transposase-like protein